MEKNGNSRLNKFGTSIIVCNLIHHPIHIYKYTLDSNYNVY